MDVPPITVFGGSGFLGRRLVATLLAAGEPVRLVARHPDAVHFNDETRLQRVSADIADETAVAQAVAGSRAVINAVSLYVERAGLTFDAVHVRGAARVARAVRHAAVPRLLHLSGIGADPASPSAYVRARAQGEQAVRGEFQPATLIRPAALFGADDALLASLAMVSRLPVVPLFGRGDTRLQPVWVEDVARGLAILACRKAAPAPLYELGGGAVYRYRDLQRRVLTHLRRRRPLIPVPFPLWHGLAAGLSLLPSPPLTRDQVYLLQYDNIAAPDMPSFDELGILPRSVGEALPECLPIR
ncbi:epimerase [Alcanivorax sp. N3-2A]|nr:epimerase [Alcanivorax sp. N3-2A]|tara:strand:- start:11979 stop:12878 length:900 start_codon:yes stop_codon:yes gene_type:complete